MRKGLIFRGIHDANGNTFNMFLNNILVGHVGMVNPNGHISAVWVHEDHRGRGFGQKIMRYTVDWAAKERFSELSLDVWKDNHCAIHVYESVGFVKEQHPFLSSAWVMKLKIAAIAAAA